MMNLKKRQRTSKKMWIVAQIKHNESSILIESFKEKLGSSPELYSPKILIEKITKNKISSKKKFILDNYVFLKHEKFIDKKIVSSLKYSKGLHYILPFFENSQKEILSFISKCKTNENKLGYLSQSFFELVLNKKLELNTGPFAKFVGEVIEIQKNKIKLLVKNYTVSISSEKAIIFQKLKKKMIEAGKKINFAHSGALPKLKFKLDIAS